MEKCFQILREMISNLEFHIHYTKLLIDLKNKHLFSKAVLPYVLSLKAVRKYLLPTKRGKLRGRKMWDTGIGISPES